MIDDIDRLIETMEMTTSVFPYHAPQLHFDGDAQQIRDFMRYMVNHSEHYRVDILKGIARESAGMLVSDVLQYVDDESFAGIKVVYNPYLAINEWEIWDDGYIEGYLRTMTSPDYFIWTYAKMSRLKAILADNTDNLRLLK